MDGEKRAASPVRVPEQRRQLGAGRSVLGKNRRARWPNSAASLGCRIVVSPGGLSTTTMSRSANRIIGVAAEGRRSWGCPCHTTTHTARLAARDSCRPCHSTGPGDGESSAMRCRGRAGDALKHRGERLPQFLRTDDKVNFFVRHSCSSRSLSAGTGAGGGGHGRITHGDLAARERLRLRESMSSILSMNFTSHTVPSMNFLPSR